MKKQNSKTTYVLDTFALLAFYNKESGWKKVKKLLEKAERDEVILYLCEINIGEIYYIVTREQDNKSARLLLDNLLKLPINFIQIKLERILKAADFKAQGGLSYADCFVLALAKEFEATILTGDSEFKKAEQEFSIDWITIGY